MLNRAAYLRLACSIFTLAAAAALLLTSAFDAPAQPIITNAPGYVITWEGNDGVNPTPPNVPTNIASASQGAIAFASGQLGPQIGAAQHYATNLNDGFYGGEGTRQIDTVTSEEGVPPVSEPFTWGAKRGRRESVAATV